MIETSLASLVASLVEILEAQAADFDRLLHHLRRGESAVRSADVQELLLICGEEKVITNRLQELERQRSRISGTILGHLDHPDRPTGPVRTGELVDHLPADLAAVVTAAIAELRCRAEETSRRSSILRAAATTLCQHFGGVIQAVNAKLSEGATTYGRAGKIESPEKTNAMLDIRR